MWRYVVGAFVGVGVLFAAGLLIKEYGKGQYQAGWDARDVAALRVINEHQQAQLEREREQMQITAEISASFARSLGDLRGDFRRVQKEIPVVLPPDVSDRYPWPVGAVRLHDAAVARVAVSELPDPAGRADDAASEFGAADGISVVLSNYKQCEADRARLRMLQSWVVRQAETAE